LLRLDFLLSSSESHPSRQFLATQYLAIRRQCPVYGDDRDLLLVPRRRLRVHGIGFATTPFSADKPVFLRPRPRGQLRCCLRVLAAILPSSGSHQQPVFLQSKPSENIIEN